MLGDYVLKIMKTYSIRAQRRIIKMKKIGLKTLVIRANGKSKLMNFKKNGINLETSYKREGQKEYISGKVIKSKKYGKTK